MYFNLKKFLVVWFCLLPSWVEAQCDVEAAQLYEAFKLYRERINTATQLEQLTPYFSSAFNQYYADKLSLDRETRRYLTHYWDNLNTAKDIVIVYDYSAKCEQADRAALRLLVILNEPGLSETPPESRLDLWHVTVYFQREEEYWLIDSFEYRKSRSNKSFSENHIIDNFAVPR